ncbi:MAG: chromosome segregation protein SMC [Planctomycetota bacterium]
MRLKRLELFGFKSFADRTVIEFPSGFTGIVGPNGCGKSNVVDAVRWVLGETRPTSMRGGEMTDVIFKGSTSRPGMGLAEVTLVLDNSCGTLPMHGGEVAVTRRVHKDGEGEYEIDGTRVRLKDVRDLLFDTGLGSRGYAVLEQGKIDAVLSANPQDRRSIFEEAAGISRYRQRRKETESRLKRVDQDMERIDSVLRELRTQERSLKIQAGKAERWVEARDQWRERGVTYAQHQLASYETKLGELGGTLDEHRSAIDAARAKREGGEAAVLAERERVDAAATEAESLAAEAARAAADLSGARERREALLAHRDSALRTAQEESIRVEELSRRLADRSSELTVSEQELAGFERRAGELSQELESAQESAREVERVYRSARERTRDLSDRVAECLQERTASLSDLRHVESELGPAGERVERERAAAASARERVAAARESRDEAQGELARAEVALSEAQLRVEELARELEATTVRRSEAADELRRIEVERAGLESRVQALLDREREWETLEDGARTLLERASRGEAGLPPLGGLLADHVHVPTRFAKALDAALGSAAVGIVVDDHDGAQRIASWLASEKLGRTRLVLPRPLNPGRCEPCEPELPYALRERVVGCLLDHVDADAGYAPLARVLLCDCLLVEDLDAAVQLAELLPGWRFVTLDGDLVDASGVTTGHAETAHGPVGRRSEASELRERAAVLGERAAEVARTVALHDDEHANVESQLRSARGTLEGAATGLAEWRSRAKHADERLHESEAFAADRERSVADRERELQDLRGRIEGARETYERANAAFEAENAELGGAETERAELEERRVAAESRTQAARVALAELEADQRASLRRAHALRETCSETQREIARSRELSERHAADAERNRVQADELEQRTTDLAAREAELAESARAARELERELRGVLDERRREIDAVTEELERAMQATSRIELEQQRAEMARDELLRRCADDFQLDREWLVEDFTPDPELAEPEQLVALGEQVAELKRQLEKLGPVNLEAVEQLGEVSQRLGFLDVQRTDLAESKAELERTLETINSESEKLFVETFEEIRGHFREIFRRLFGGGRADVLLEQGVSVLEAGIEIVARPPGREQLPIGLLSGGQRTMTALALLFAVFQSRPSPFCVLDEVDAALDDANVGRFLGMLESFLEHSQFIVVTHNKGTMAASDMLHGITMETKGVSCRVSVELDEVDAFAPEATGSFTAADSRGDDEAADDEPEVELIPMPSRAETGLAAESDGADADVDEQVPHDSSLNRSRRSPIARSWRSTRRA